jgi:hypothetical protein
VHCDWDFMLLDHNSLLNYLFNLHVGTRLEILH